MISAAIDSASELKTGEPTTLTLSLTAKNGKPVAPADLQVAHTEKLHLLIVDPSLSDYHHEHPVPKKDGKVLTFKLTPRKAGPYRVFVDVLPEATRRHLYLVADLAGTGAGGPIEGRELVTSAQVDGYSFELMLPAVVKEGTTLNGELGIKDRDGKVVTQLEPVMGAYAHLVGFFEDRKTVEHMHPMGAEPTAPSDRGVGKLRFRVTPTKSGLMKLFAQVKLDGKERFAPFTLNIAPK